MDSDLEWKLRIRAAFESGNSLPEDDVLEELAGHAQAMYEASRAAGCAPDEADSAKTRSQKQSEIINDPAVKTVLLGLDATITHIDDEL